MDYLTLRDESNVVVRNTSTWKHSAGYRRIPEGSLSKTAVRTSDLEIDTVPYFMWAPDTAPSCDVINTMFTR